MKVIIVLQGLSLQVISERSSGEVDIFEDAKEMSSVYTENFADEHEWLIYEHVESTTKAPAADGGYHAEVYHNDEDVLSDSFAHASASFTCHVARRPGFFLWILLENEESS